MIRQILTFLFLISVVQSHHIIKILLSFETAKYSDTKYCGFKHMKSITNAFKDINVSYIDKPNFCSLCEQKKLFKQKYHVKTKDDSVENVKQIVKNVTKILNMVCPAWDEELRVKNFDDTLKWIIKNRQMVHKNECVGMVKTLISKYKNEKEKEFMNMILEILLDKHFRLGWVGIVSDFESKKAYLGSCFDVINAFTYFKQDICSNGAFKTILKENCHSSCLKIESRLVSNALNDCCNDCIGDITLLDDLEKDLIDIRPFNEWKSII